MKSRTLILMVAMAELAATAISVPLSAQEQQNSTRVAPSPAVSLHGPLTGKGSYQHAFPSTINGGATIRRAPIDASHLADGPLRTADGTLSPNIIIFEAPHAGTGEDQGTFPVAINEDGKFTGFSIDEDGAYHGFAGNTSQIITFDVSGAGGGDGQGTIPQGISRAGITGSYIGPDGVSHGFVVTPEGTLTRIDVPGAHATYPRNIDDEGTVSGYYTDQRGYRHGFEVTSKNVFTTFDAPGALDTFVTLGGMTADEWITGFSNDGHTNYGYLRNRNGTMIPSISVYGSLFTEAEGTTSGTNHTVVGQAVDASFVYHAFEYLPKGVIQELNDPDAGTAPLQGTVAYAVNPSNVVIGQFADINSYLNGFEYKDGVFTTVDILGATTSPQAINKAGTFVCFFLDTNGAAIGCVDKP